MRIEVFKKFSPGVISLVWMDIKHIVLSWSLYTMYLLHPHALARLTKSQHDFLLLELMMEQPINELGRISENNGFADENIDGFHREMR